ncbi:AbrB family transcriptional regulator [Scleromatobacter humisilvae]|uniref:AbrB family transcriptional regulator n=1 Tax=Scleromatobacter humisilvae TaxID=2897159 RepID=A0A9X1YG12_9BURK|nr:AbrB family transcriptional regulator [Scleromatobacter humisilvae]MCK9685839.1 AbrB family transcriptional regulator [Scleromatobacter humisilvae]
MHWAAPLLGPILGAIGKSWPLFAVILSVLLGWARARWRLLPGTTAVWGSLPGEATAMVLMGEAFGADVRLVAPMQCLRVLLVGAAATAVTRLWLPTHAASASLIPVHGPLHPAAFAETLVLAADGAGLAVRLRIPAGALLLPMFAGVVLNDTGLLAIELPWWLLAACYALIAPCGALARVVHVDPLTACLATNPGGADTVAIIAGSSPVDVLFVLAIVRFVARRRDGAQCRISGCCASPV